MALPRRRRPHRRILTASAAKIGAEESTDLQRRGMPWQQRALTYLTLVPELNYASRFYSRMLKRIRVYPAVRTSDDKTEPIESGPPVDLLDRIQDAGGGRSHLQGAYGRLQFVTGEGNLLGLYLDSEKERWIFVWNDEVEATDNGGIIWKPTIRSAVEFGPNDAVAYRMWTPSPERSGEADSPMRAVLEIAEELVALTRAVRATAVSRIPNGLLKVPTEISFGPAVGGSDEDPEENPFLADLIEHITGVVENAGTPEAASPFIAEAAAEFLDALEWINLHDPNNDYLERALREEAVRRLAFGLDMPPEVLLGLADANHWTGRQITHDMWRSHGAPIAEQFCDDLSEVYLRPALRDAGYGDWQSVVVAYDDADVVVSPDRSEDADRAFDRGGIGWPGYRKLKGIPDSMAMTEDEMKIWLAMKMRDPSFLQGTPFETDPLVPGERGPSASPPDERDAEEGPPEPGPGGVSRRESRTASARVLGWADAAIVRCREVAGARIRSKLRNDPTLLQMVDGKPNTMVFALVGRDRVRQLIGDDDPLKLVHGGTDSFMGLLLDDGFSVNQASALSEIVRVYAAKTLLEQERPKLPSGFQAQVQRMREISDEVGG